MKKKNSSPLKVAYNKLKNPYWRAKKKYTTYFDTLPIDERAILVESQHGSEMDGNVFYILKYLFLCGFYLNTNFV